MLSKLGPIFTFILGNKKKLIGAVLALLMGLSSIVSFFPGSGVAKFIGSLVGIAQKVDAQFLPDPALISQ